jgi:hypothetical protein
MAYRCNPCRHTSAPFPIARSVWDMHQNAYFCPDCVDDYTLSTNKYPNPPPPKGNCGCGCKPCCCRSLCDYKPHKPLMGVDPCFPPHPAVSPPACLIRPHLVPPHVVPHPVPPPNHPVVPHPVPPPNHPVVPHPVPPPNHPVVPHPVVPHKPVSPPHVTPVPKADSLASFFFFE